MKAQQDPLNTLATAVAVEQVVEQELMGDARHRDPDSEAADRESGEQFVEVDDPVGTECLDPVADQVHAAVEGPQPLRGNIAQQRAEHADRPVVVIEGKLRGFEFGDRSSNLRTEKGRQRAQGAAAHEDSDKLMAVATEHLCQRKRLREMSPPLSLYSKKEPHQRTSFSAS